MKERKVPLRIALPSDEAAAENEDQTGPGIVLLDRNGRIAIQDFLKLNVVISFGAPVGNVTIQVPSEKRIRVRVCLTDKAMNRR